MYWLIVFTFHPIAYCKAWKHQVLNNKAFITHLLAYENVYGVGSPTVGPTSSSVRLHIFVPSSTYMTEISLIVTLNNQFTFTFTWILRIEIEPFCCHRNPNCLQSARTVVFWGVKSLQIISFRALLNTVNVDIFAGGNFAKMLPRPFMWG